jgi:hypothetical protein
MTRPHAEIISADGHLLAAGPCGEWLTIIRTGMAMTACVQNTPDGEMLLTNFDRPRPLVTGTSEARVDLTSDEL